MKLVFRKNEKQEISVLSKDGDNIAEFNYIDMIKNLINVKRLEEPELDGDFSDSEQASIFSMISHINNEVNEFYSKSLEDSEDED